MRHGRLGTEEELLAAEADYTAAPMALLLALILLRETGIRPRRILDPAAGSGSWGRAAAVAWPEAELVALEPREQEAPGLRRVYHRVVVGRFGEADVGGPYDLLLGNPPFTSWSAGWHASARRQGLLTPGGLVALLGLSQWGQSRQAWPLLRAWPPELQVRTGGRMQARGDGSTDARETSLWVFREGRAPEAQPRWSTVQAPPLGRRLHSWSLGRVPGVQPLLGADIAAVRALAR